jgi:uncharacterized protein YbjT (DUF2867 family)
MAGKGANAMTTTILVTGATGNLGSQLATQLLRDGDVRVRAAVRSNDAPKAVELAERGAQLVRFDYTDEASMRDALAGVDRAFLVAPLVEDLDRLVTTSIDAARSAGVSHIVRASALGADADAPFALARWHGRADEYLARTGLAYTILKPTFFQDNALNFHGETIRAQGAFYGASGQGRSAYISSADIARTAAAILRDPSRHTGKTYVLTGGEALTDGEVATMLGEVAGRPIAYVNLEPEALAAGVRDSGAPEWLVEALVGLEGVKAQGFAAEISPAVAEITGQAPEPYRTFLDRHAAALR